MTIATEKAQPETLKDVRHTSSHALLSVLAAHGVDRVFLVPGESYLGLLDALSDFPGIDVVTCRHEAGAGFMACADARLTRRPGVVMVSRGPGATNAAIALHTAEQDGLPLILIVGQVPKAYLRRGAFQEIDYQQFYGSIAKWVCEVTDSEELAAAVYKAIRVAVSGTPGPVVLVIPEDIQQQPAALPAWPAVSACTTLPSAQALSTLHKLLAQAKRPLVIAGGMLAAPGGREALLRLVESFRIPVAVSFRHHDLFPNCHPLYVGDLGLSNPQEQIEAFEASDLVFALGTRLGDITSQGYRFPRMPRPSQTLVHCYPDERVVGRHFVPDLGLTCDPTALAAALGDTAPKLDAPARDDWSRRLRAIRERIGAWPQGAASDGVAFVEVVHALARQAPADSVICLDAGTFAAPVYRHFPFVYPQRLMAPLSGAMGFGTPAAIAAQLRLPRQKVICLVGDGGFMMTGNEMIAAAERRLPVLFILANNHCYGSIRVHQERTYPGRYVGTSLTNPQFVSLAQSFGIAAEKVACAPQVEGAISRGLAAAMPYFIEVITDLPAVAPRQALTADAKDLSGD